MTNERDKGTRKSSIDTESIKYRLLGINIVPIILMGILICICSAKVFTMVMNEEVKRGLASALEIVTEHYNTMYPGDYGLHKHGDEYVFTKGDTVLSESFEFVDNVKARTEIDVSFFIFDLRGISTIRNKSLERIVGTAAHSTIVQNVFKEEKAQFFHSVLIEGKEYFAYYVPLRNSDGKVIGMAACAKPVELVRKDVLRSVMPIIIITIIVTIISAIISLKYTKQIVWVIHEMKAFLRFISRGNLNNQIGSRVISRKDELGDIGRYLVSVQNSLKEIVERDSLTGLINRRTGEKRINNSYKIACEHNDKYECAVVLGDVDYFKRFNDKYGHDCGDLVLKKVARVLLESVAGKGYVARWGGEEFLIVIEDTNIEDTKNILNLIINTIRNSTVMYGDNNLNVTITFGVVMVDGDLTPNEAIKAADNKLYEGKLKGRDRIEY